MGHLPATLRAVTPYTLSWASTTPPMALGFIAQVPSYHNTIGNRSKNESGQREAYRVPGGGCYSHHVEKGSKIETIMVKKG
jgi:hypothetical protein